PYGFVNLQKLERLFFRDIIIYADDDFLFAVDGYLIAIRRFGNFALRESALDRGDHAAQGVNFLDVIPGAAFHLIGERFDEVRPTEGIGCVRDAALVSDDLLGAKGE